MSRPTIFLDRDGTINYDPGYLNNPDNVCLIEGTGEALKMLKNAGYLLLVVSNQSGIARGLITHEEVKVVNSRIQHVLDQYYSVKIDHFFYCPHHELFSNPDECNCRKPEIGMFKQAIELFDVDITKSFMVGDSEADILAAHKFGIASILVDTGNGSEHISVLQDQNKLPNFTCSNLYESAKLILKLKTGVSVC
jgi:histidinol-phosphate phosphatase family protein